MRIGIALVLAAAGAIIRFAVEPSSHVMGTSVNWDIVGDILMAVGIVGVLIAVVSMAAAGRQTTTGTTDVNA
jgi:hypothetical protein